MSSILSKLKPGDSVYTVLRYKKESVTVWSVHLFFDGIPYDASGVVSTAIKRSYHQKHQGIALRGYGWHDDQDIVNELSHALFGEDGKLVCRRI